VCVRSTLSRHVFHLVRLLIEWTINEKKNDGPSYQRGAYKTRSFRLMTAKEQLVFAADRFHIKSGLVVRWLSLFCALYVRRYYFLLDNPLSHGNKKIRQPCVSISHPPAA
jgi:hypothetical protein